jgi:Dyp-type peroxidase family
MRSEDFADVQGNILRGYRMPQVAHLFARIEAEQAPRWKRVLAELLPAVTPADWGSRRPLSTLNVGISYAGIEQLRPDLAAAFGERFPAFRAGMAGRSAELGDPAALGELRAFRDHHLWFAIHGVDAESVAARVRALLALAPGLGLIAQTPWGAAIEKDGHWYEHFGFRDDISYPALEGVPSNEHDVAGRGKWVDGSWQRIACGEFVLGHADERGVNALDGLSFELAPLLNNATFGVFQRLRQDVPAFLDYVASLGRAHGLSADAIAAKLVGRTPSGDSLACPGRESDFTYEDDAEGAGCPLGAHVRRANPRTSGEHRLIRRGMPYGPPYAAGASDSHAERGLYFVVFNAKIEDQFEFIQQAWLNGPAGALRNARDPLVGAGAGARRMLIEGDVNEPRPPLLLLDIPDFVRCTGGEYYLLPGLAGLRHLAGTERSSRVRSHALFVE